MTSVTWVKVKRIVHTRGWAALLRTGFTQIKGLITAWNQLGEKRTFGDVKELLDYSRALGGGIVSAMQVDSEIEAFLSEVKELAPKTLLEIGTANGGTLFLLSRVASPDATLISLDLPGGIHGEGYAIWRSPMYRRFGLSKQHIKLIRANSHLRDTLQQIRSILGMRKLDLLFIDGDHTYEGVKRDYDLYRDLVRPGGLIAFHDIALSRDPTSQVNRLWDELRSEPGAKEWIDNPTQGWAGIGAIRV